MNYPPQGNDIMAMTIGALAPCVSAPWWEEVSKWSYEYACVALLYILCNYTIKGSYSFVL